MSQSDDPKSPAPADPLRSAALEELSWVAGQIAALQRLPSPSSAPLHRLIPRLIRTRLLYWLSRQPRFSAKRRARLRKSAEKRDPILLARAVDELCLTFTRRLTARPELAAAAAQDLAALGLRVTAIVPNYNHAPFLAQRIDSILNQTYPLLDILILDDASTDDSRAVIADYAARHPGRIRTLLNAENSGNVFAQWRKGVEAATGDLVWICESDDFAEPDFLARLIPAFRDPSVTLAFGRIQFAEADGTPRPGLDHYREEAEPGIWSDRLVRPAADWFAHGFGVKNVIANVGGALIRRGSVGAAVWDRARTFRIMGDWYLYAALAGGGQIAFDPAAVAYFRQHGANTSGREAQSRPDYYAEYERLMTELRRLWPIPPATVERFVAQAHDLFRARRIAAPPFGELVSAARLNAVPREVPHVLMAIMGFSYGGGEFLPIHLANELHRMGVTVSILQMTATDDAPDVRAMLDPAIPVYGANILRDRGAQAFLRAAGVSIVHSHVASVETLLLDEEKADIPYVVTLHGSYEAMQIAPARVRRWAERVGRFAYLADRNLTPFDEGLRGGARFVRVRNAMPADPRPFPRSRAAMGIAEDAVVFTLVARGIEGKGWSEAVAAFQALKARRPDRRMALVLAGDGPATEAARARAAGDPDIHFLGFAREINGLYRMSDVALVPTRYAGESFPLCLVQAIQEGLPCLATDIGEIGGIFSSGPTPPGHLVPLIADDAAFIAAVSAGMEALLEPDARARLADGARAMAPDFAMDRLAADYLALYREVLGRPA